jgi:hypothetical protein
MTLQQENYQSKGFCENGARADLCIERKVSPAASKSHSQRLLSIKVKMRMIHGVQLSSRRSKGNQGEREATSRIQGS